MQAVQEIQNSLVGLKLGSPQVHLNLALFPLLDERETSPDYLLLDEALERKLARVTEVTGEGRVPELAFENASSEKILLVDGDELVGAKQNRILNLSILVGVGQKIAIPVSCVEQGRWSYRGRDFRSAGRALFGKARAKKVQRVSESLRSSGDRHSNQSEIWADVAGKAASSDVSSATMSMGDIYEDCARQVNAYVTAFQAERRQRGAVVAIDGKPVGGGTLRPLDCLRAGATSKSSCAAMRSMRSKPRLASHWLPLRTRSGASSTRFRPPRPSASPRSAKAKTSG